MKIIIWKPVFGYEGLYSISEYGDLRRENSAKGHKNGLYKGYISKKGYLTASLTKNGVRKIIFIHKLVTENFIGPRPWNLQVNHKDTNKLNNHFSNLEYVTVQENKRHAFENNLCNAPKGINHHSAKLSEKEVLEVRRRYANKEISQGKLAKIYGVSLAAIRFIIIRRNWKHL